ncbi:hypothetical protein [Cupriavidus sp. 8B]
MHLSQQFLNSAFQVWAMCERHDDLVAGAVLIDAAHPIFGQAGLFDPLFGLGHAAHELAVALDMQVAREYNPAINKGSMISEIPATTYTGGLMARSWS